MVQKSDDLSLKSRQFSNGLEAAIVLSVTGESMPLIYNGLYRARMIRAWNSAPDADFSFVRANGEDKVFVAINFSDEPHSVTFTDVPFTGRYTEYFSGESVAIDDNFDLDIEP